MVTAFATGRGPSADEAKAITALGEHDRQEPTGLGRAEEHRAGLGLGVSRVVHDEAEWIANGGDSLVEGDPMLADVRAGQLQALWAAPTQINTSAAWPLGAARRAELWPLRIQPAVPTSLAPLASADRRAASPSRFTSAMTATGPSADRQVPEGLVG